MSGAAKKPPGYRSQDRAHKRKACIDCVAEAEELGTPVPRRKAPHPGPRCASHARAKKAQRKDVTREQRWMQVYGIAPEEYWRIYDLQNGVCYICERAKGTGKRALSVDHCHRTGVVRGLLCLPCNRYILGHARDDIGFFERAIDYLNSPPAVRAIGVRIVPDYVEE